MKALLTNMDVEESSTKMNLEQVNIKMNVEELSSDENEGEVAPFGWSREDKYTLLQAIKFSDSSDIERIQLSLPSKTTEEISQVIAFYKKKAQEHPKVKDRMTRERRAMTNISQVPLSQWTKLLTDTFTYKELETETATALRLIAEFDNIPGAVCTGGVDFKAVYHALANSMEGKSLPDDKLINAILEKCIIETAYSSKAFIRNTAFKNVIHQINLTDKEISSFPRPTDNHELNTLRHLSSQRRYNPLNISETYLKPTVYTNLSE